MKGSVRELEVAVSVCASLEDAMTAQRVLAGVVGSHVWLRSFNAGVAVFALRVADRNLEMVAEALREGCADRFSVSETRHGRLEMWTRDPAPLPMTAGLPSG